MPDITMCKGEDCPLRESCYRYKAKPNEFGQSYFYYSPIQGEECKYYWEWRDIPRTKYNPEQTDF